MARCKDCNYDSDGKCSACQGTGHIVQLELALETVDAFDALPCWRCKGTGQCQSCGGTGEF